MNRRDFVQALGAASLAVNRSGASARIRPIGLQLYTVRQAMQADVEGTLARVAQIGYTEVEFAGYFDHTPQQIRDMLRRHHLTSPSAHVPIENVTNGWQATIDAAKIIGHEYITVAWTPEELRRTLDGWRRIADMYNRAAREAKAAGLEFAYHNHSYEFEPMEGKLPYDVLIDNTDPDLVKLEIDLFWMTRGGQDPLAYFARYPGRIPMVHVKDMTTDKRMVDVGAGSIDWRRIFAQRAQAGIRHYFVEHDEPVNPFASIANSYHYLSRLEV
ncbi:MAG TPA: sugar phosphate isomerase/epimerase [Gemmatimonadales bacterium]